jgi:hypothetical protein
MPALAPRCAAGASQFLEEKVVMKIKILLSMLAVASTINAATILSENFDDITTLAGSGWVQNNVSTPTLGSTNWFQGNDTVFGSYEGAANSYIGANYNNVAGAGTISNYLITPVLNTSSSDLSFYTRTVPEPVYADRLRVLWSGNGASTTLSDFTTILLDINSAYGSDYPNAWTNFTVAVPTGTGRLAFQYFVENGGPNGSYSDYIGIDSVTVSANAVGEIPEPGSVVLLGGGLAALALLRRKFSTRG